MLTKLLAYIRKKKKDLKLTIYVPTSQNSKEDQSKPGKITRKEKIKIKTKVSKIENIKTTDKIHKTEGWFLKNSIKWIDL